MQEYRSAYHYPLYLLVTVYTTFKVAKLMFGDVFIFNPLKQTFN